MYKEVLRSIEGIEIFPIISLIIFGLFFTGLFFYVFGFKKHFLQDMSNMPLVDSENEHTQQVKNEIQ